MRSIAFAPVWACLLLLPTLAAGQTRNEFNPEISFISDVRARAGDPVAGDLEFEFVELEIGATAPLNPFALGSVFIGLHDGEAEVEEAFVDFTALPGNLGLRAGRFFVDQGRFAIQHSHMFPFLDYPQLVTGYFGEEGFGAVGVNPSWLTGIGDVAITVSGNALGALEDHHHEDHGDEEAAKDEHEGEEEEPRFLRDLTYTGRISVFFPLGDVTNLDVGAGGGTRVLEPAEQIRATWFGADFKYKWRPNTRQSFTLAAEVLFHEQDVEDHEEAAKAEGDLTAESATAFFAAADLQFRRHWNVGALVDFAQSPEHADEDRTGVGVFLGYSLFEESTLIRFLARQDSYSTTDDDDLSFQLQLVSSLGPHKPHQF